MLIKNGLHNSEELTPKNKRKKATKKCWSVVCCGSWNSHAESHASGPQVEINNGK
jgi:hypothetical protein